MSDQIAIVRLYWVGLLRHGNNKSNEVFLKIILAVWSWKVCILENYLMEKCEQKIPFPPSVFSAFKLGITLINMQFSLTLITSFFRSSEAIWWGMEDILKIIFRGIELLISSAVICLTVKLRIWGLYSLS